MKESFGIFIFVIFRPYQGVEFIIKESLLEQNLLFIINLFTRAKGKRKIISPPLGSEKMKRGGSSFFIVVEELPTFNSIYPLEVNWCCIYLYFFLDPVSVL